MILGPTALHGASAMAMRRSRSWSLGHFDDPLAADCSPEARQICLDRLVVDKIAYFAPDRAVAPSLEPTSSPVPTPTAVETPANTSMPTTTAPTDAATAACSNVMDKISPMVTLRSGEVTVAAAYEVTGAQLTRYFTTVLNQGGGGSQGNGSDWWNNPNKLVGLCILDGDFNTETPGPSPLGGVTPTASRVAVVIEGSDAQAWAFCFSDTCGITTTDPATIPAVSSPPPARPVDPSIQPVSRSSPGPDAQAALDACNVDSLGDGTIAGMGLVPEANQVRNYAPLTGREPELQSAAPAWMIQFSGDIPQLLAGEVWRDPICVVIDGSPGWYATGDVIVSSGAVVSPEPVAKPPIYSLPSLVP